MRRARRPFRLDAKSTFALWAIVGGVVMQVVILLGLVFHWWA